MFQVKHKVEDFLPWEGTGGSHGTSRLFPELDEEPEEPEEKVFVQTMDYSMGLLFKSRFFSLFELASMRYDVKVEVVYESSAILSYDVRIKLTGTEREINRFCEMVRI